MHSLAEETMWKLIFGKGQELMGQEEVMIVISGRENSTHRCSEGKSMLGLYLYLGFGCRAGAEAQEIKLRSF